MTILKAIIVAVTVYNAVPEQTNSDPGHTASGYKLDLLNPAKHKIIAISRDLESVYGFKFGDSVRITGTTDLDGIYVIEDRMHPRKRMQIDILVNNNRKLGKWNNVTLEKI